MVVILERAFALMMEYKRSIQELDARIDQHKAELVAMQNALTDDILDDEIIELYEARKKLQAEYNRIKTERERASHDGSF